MNDRGFTALRLSSLPYLALAFVAACSQSPSVQSAPGADLSVCSATCGCGMSCDDLSVPDLAPPPPPNPGVFVGKWSPISGTGAASCNGGPSMSLPPNPNAVLMFAQDSANTLMATSAEVNCPLELSVVGTTASLEVTALKLTDAAPYQICTDSSGEITRFWTFDLVFNPGPQTTDGGSALDTLDWILDDSNVECGTYLHYTLGRAQ
jgi:hypothetical protein